MWNKFFIIILFILFFGFCTKIIYRESNKNINIDTIKYKIIKIDTIEGFNRKILQIIVKNKN